MGIRDRFAPQSPQQRRTCSLVAPPSRRTLLTPQRAAVCSARLPQFAAHNSAIGPPDFREDGALLCRFGRPIAQPNGYRSSPARCIERCCHQWRKAPPCGDKRGTLLTPFCCALACCRRSQATSCAVLHNGYAALSYLVSGDHAPVEEKKGVFAHACEIAGSLGIIESALSDKVLRRPLAPPTPGGGGGRSAAAMQRMMMAVLMGMEPGSDDDAEPRQVDQPCMQAISKLCEPSPRNQQRAAECGAVEAVVAALRNSSGDTGVQMGGLMALMVRTRLTQHCIR